jgi:O-antigen/teichoic acid export membrane protein
LGERSFSIYQVIVSLIGWSLLCSLGFGPALKNFISEQRAHQEPDDHARQMMSLAVLIFLACFMLAFSVISPALANALLGRLTGGDSWANSSFLVAGMLIIVIGIGQVGQEALFADGRGQWVYLLPAAGQGVGLVLVYSTSSKGLMGTNPLLWVVSLWLAPQAVAALAALQLGGVLRWPRWHFDPSIVRRLGRSAWYFFWLALLSNMVLMVDFVVMSQILPPSEIVLYTVMIGIVNVMLLFYTSVLMIFWPEWSRQLHHGHFSSVRLQVFRLAGACVIACIALGVAMTFLLPPALQLWLGRPDFQVSVLTIVFFCGYLAIRIWSDTHSVALMSCNQTKWLVLTVIVQALINLPAEVLLGRALGANGIVAGLITGFLMTAAWMLPFRFYRLTGHNLALSASRP